MSDLKDFRIVQDAGQRTEWINKRTPLSETQKQYVEFQIKEAITNVLRLANVDNKEQGKALRLPEVISCFLKETAKNNKDYSTITIQMRDNELQVQGHTPIPYGQSWGKWLVAESRSLNNL